MQVRGRAGRTRRLAPLIATVLMALLPATVAAAVPVANDDPGLDCGPMSTFGGSLPIPEDFLSSNPDGTFFPGDHRQWYPLFGNCSLLKNDTDADGDPLTYEIVSGPTHGQVMKVDDEWTAYKPDPDWSTRAGDLPGGDWVSDSFTYRACDASDCSAPATMRYWIAPIDDPPTFTAGPAMVEVEEDTGAYSGPWASDISPGPNEAYQHVGFEVVSLDVTGVPDLFAVPPAIDNSGVLTFTPGPDQFGLAIVTVEAKDDGAPEDWQTTETRTPPKDTSDPVSFEIVIQPKNDAPIAVDDHFDISAGVPTSLDVLANDHDVDGDPISIASATSGSKGEVALTGGGTGLTYTPGAGQVGTDSFTYAISDGNGGNATAAVTTFIGADVAPPVVSIPAERFPGQTVSSSSTKLRVGWSGSDAGSGIAQYRFQMSTNGGAFTTVTLSSSTSTSSSPGLKHGSTYRFRVRAEDREGNWSAYVQTPTYTFVRYSQDSAVYVGAWSKVTSSSAIGGTARSSSSSVKSASLTFTGYDVGWVATRTTSSGRARVLVDGVLVATVDLDVSKTAYRQLVFQQHFAVSGTHTLRIEPVGDGRVDIDAFVVLR